MLGAGNLTLDDSDNSLRVAREHCANYVEVAEDGTVYDLSLIHIFSVFIPGLQNTISAVCGFPSKISLPKSIVMRGGPPGSVFLMVIRGF